MSTAHASPVFETLRDRPNAACPEFTFAYQPIIDVVERKIVSYEALVRGRANEPAFKVFQQVDALNMHKFDVSCRVAAVELACRLGITCGLNLNFLPRSLFSNEQAIHITVQAAKRNHFDLSRITLEVTEGEVIGDPVQLAALLDEYRGTGMRLSIDDFGAGYSGLNLLADFQPDQLKLDMKLVRNIEGIGARQSIVRAIIEVCRDLGIDMVAEGVETIDEYSWFAEHGVRFFQGYLFARPGFESLPRASFPAVAHLPVL
jgi:EAL domain-containing protein (putative c-di-GMP-specific phosphodiesterase class I)